MSKHTIIIGDVHGNFDAIAHTLMAAGAVNRDGTKNPDWRVVSVGDLCNMAPAGVAFRGFVSEDLETIGWASEIIDDLVVGNHEVFFTHGLSIGIWNGMGNPTGDEFEPDLIPFMKRMVYDGKYVAAVEVDGMLVTHAGLHRTFAEKNDFPNDPVKVAEILNDRLMHSAQIRAEPTTREYDPINHPDGIFWLRPAPHGAWNFGHGTEYVQVVGHTPRPEHPKFFPAFNAWIIDSGNYMNKDFPTVGALVKREDESEFTVFNMEGVPQ